MPSKNMLPKGHRRVSVKKEYREQRTLIQEREAAARLAGEPVEEAIEPFYDTADFIPLHTSPYANVPGLVTGGPTTSKHPQEEASMSRPRYAAPRIPAPAAPEIHVLEDLEPEDGIRTITAEPAAKDMRLDAYLARAIPDISRARVTLLIENSQVTIDGEPARGKQKLKGGEVIEIEGDPRPEPLHATPEDIPLDVVYEDDDLAVVNKTAGMMVHAGAGDEERNRGTLVNALLFHLGKNLSQVSGDLRPGIVHRLDKQTSGLIVVAKNDSTHRKLGEMFAERRLRKIYIALVHGAVEKDEGTISLPISRDIIRRTRMTTRRMGGRTAVSHYKVLDRIEGPYGKFTLVEVRIETGRTHQIRVHMQSLGHHVVGDNLYGAPHLIMPLDKAFSAGPIELERNFLHAAQLEFLHPRTKQRLELKSDLPPELVTTLQVLRGQAS
jgi:23S rRNA pseudouridine1911/1915/1917 synthase